MGDVADELERRWAEIDRRFDAERRELWSEVRRDLTGSLCVFAAPFVILTAIAATVRALEWVM